ncbi:MAG TPA: ATP-binding protein [Thermoanaerobaculia bacterium]|jgi:magnesium chelatase family protein|nr:ATP-binding protein [Thermoanaerobaculia bacterium]
MRSFPPDLSEIRGQETAKRALEVALTGGHHLLLIGPPGVGKTMLAETVPGLLPPLEPDEELALKTISTLCGGDGKSPLHQPFRRPPPTTSAEAMIGGTAEGPPGEVSLAHAGVLFLDDLPSFQRAALDGLRGPLARREVPVGGTSREAHPARFILIAAMNPCPCGWRRDEIQRCRCTKREITRYLQPVAGALLDRIDLRVWVPRVKLKELRSGAGESSETVARRVAAARRLQIDRWGKLNAELNPNGESPHLQLDKAGRDLFERAVEKLGFSARELASAVKVARTVADLGSRDSIRPAHLAEAFQYKAQSLDSPLLQ